MRFSDSFLDEIRARIPVSEVVRRKVQLRRQGREWRGLSPFNKEKTASFFVNDQKGFYYDFSAGKNGDIFTFLMETEGLSFPEAVEQLARQVGLSLPQTSKEDIQREEKRRSLGEVLELASDFFRSNLASELGTKAREYLRKRGIAVSTQEEFALGYASEDRSALKRFLSSKGVQQDAMIEAGLLIAGEDIPVSYDRFRDRIIIPIHDMRGRVIGFGGRALHPDAQPKYLNSPETPLFHKGSVVFNFHRARQAAHDDGSVIVVEGYMDAIAIYQAGIKSVVATMGTAFGEAQIESIWRLSTEPIVCFDSDRAGISAAHRSIDRILPILKVGRTFEFAFLQDGKDPDELIKQKGIEAFKDVLKGSLPLWDVLWARETDGVRIGTPDARAALEQRLYSIIKTIKDPSVNTAYFRTCRIDLSELFWQEARARLRKPLPKEGLTSKEIKITKEGYRHGIQKIILGMLVHYPELIDDFSDEVSKVKFDGRWEAFQNSLYDLLIVYRDVDVDTIYRKLSPAFFDVLNEIHGDRIEGKVRGHRLFARFPILRANPPEQFVVACLIHFVRMLQTEQLAQELGDIVKQAHRDPTREEEETMRILELTRELHLQRDRVEAREKELADEAREIRRLGERYGGWRANAAA